MMYYFDGAAYKCIEKDLYKAESPVKIKINDWANDENHAGQNIITNGFSDSDSSAVILYLSIGRTGEEKIMTLYKKLKAEKKSVGIIEGLPVISRGAAYAEN